MILELMFVSHPLLFPFRTGRTWDRNSKCINDKAGLISWMSILPFNIMEEFVLNREDISPPS